jgi:hypothetical protein
MVDVSGVFVLLKNVLEQRRAAFHLFPALPSLVDLQREENPQEFSLEIPDDENDGS